MTGELNRDHTTHDPFPPHQTGGYFIDPEKRSQKKEKKTATGSSGRETTSIGEEQHHVGKKLKKIFNWNLNWRLANLTIRLISSVIKEVFDGQVLRHLPV